MFSDLLLKVLAIPIVIVFWSITDYIMMQPTEEYKQLLKKRKEEENEPVD